MFWQCETKKNTLPQIFLQRMAGKIADLGQDWQLAEAYILRKHQSTCGLKNNEIHGRKGCLLSSLQYYSPTILPNFKKIFMYMYIL